MSGTDWPLPPGECAECGFPLDANSDPEIRNQALLASGGALLCSWTCARAYNGKWQRPSLLFRDISEAALTTRIVRRLRDRGAWVLKVHGSGWQRRGVPDLLVCAEGRFVALEVKWGTGQVTPIQRQELTRIQQAGGYATVVRSVAEAEGVLDGLLSV